MNEEKQIEFFRSWLRSFHKLRIQGFISDSERMKIWKRICKCINDAGYTVEDVGFYEWVFKKIDK